MIIWKVTQTYDDKGKIRTSIGSLEASKLPESSFEHMNCCDVYEDYFRTYKEAKKFMDQAKKA